MGVDLTFYPYQKPRWPSSGPVPHYARGGIDFGRWYELQGAITSRAKPIPKRVFLVHTQYANDDPESCMCARRSPYGDPLIYMSAGKLHDLIEGLEEAFAATTEFPEEASQHWRKHFMPIIRKLARLERSTPVILEYS